MEVFIDRYVRLESGLTYDPFKSYKNIYGNKVDIIGKDGFFVWISVTPQKPFCEYSYSILHQEQLKNYIVGEWKEPLKFDSGLCPKWAAGYAMDKNGLWHVYEKPPQISTDKSYWVDMNGYCGDGIRIPNHIAPKFSGDWKDSFVANPDYEKQEEF